MTLVNSVVLTAFEAGPLRPEDAVESVSLTFSAFAERGLCVRREVTPYDPQPGHPWEAGDAMAVHVEGAPLAAHRNLLSFHEAWRDLPARFAQGLAIKWSDEPGEEEMQVQIAARLLRALAEHWVVVRSVSLARIRALAHSLRAHEGGYTRPALDLGWWTWLGPAWVERLGSAALQAAPVHRVYAVGDGLALQLTVDLGDDLDPGLDGALRASIPTLPPFRVAVVE